MSVASAPRVRSCCAWRSTCFSPEERQLSAETHRWPDAPSALRELHRGTVGQRRNEATSRWAGQSSRGGASHWPARGPAGHGVGVRGTGLAQGESFPLSSVSQSAKPAVQPLQRYRRALSAELAMVTDASLATRMAGFFPCLSADSDCRSRQGRRQGHGSGCRPARGPAGPVGPVGPVGKEPREDRKASSPPGLRKPPWQGLGAGGQPVRASLRKFLPVQTGSGWRAGHEQTSWAQPACEGRGGR